MAVLHCQRKCTPSFFDKEDFRTDHTVTQEIDGKWYARCDACGTEGWHAIPGNKVNPAYLTKWPKIESSSGIMMKSKEHQAEVMKRKGWKAVE
jgi:hypothetical protein